MTTSDTMSYPAPPPAAGQRRLRRNRKNRVAAGVCSGLGDYFGLDPVLFRVLFATAAFFGGAGILAYLLAWAAIPDIETEHAPIDRFIAWLRQRRFPVWLAGVIAGLFLWAVAFSWWAPGPFFWVIAVVVLLVVIFGRRELQASAANPPTTGVVDLTKDGAPDAARTDNPTWVRDARSWFDEAREASRRRRQRSLPIRIGMLVTLVAAWTVLGIADGLNGIQLQYYFWTLLAVVGGGILAGLVARRTPWGVTPLLIPAVAGAIAFAGSHASLHDGIGQREWKPAQTPAAEYKLAFGQGILDLTQADIRPGQTVDVTMGAGQVKIIAPTSMNLTVLANIHIGQLDVDGAEFGGRHGHGGVGLSRTVSPPPHARGPAITVDVHLADGNITVEHR